MKTLVNSEHNIKPLSIKNSHYGWAKNWTKQVQFLKNNPEAVSVIGTNDYCYYLNEAERN